MKYISRLIQNVHQIIMDSLDQKLMMYYSNIFYRLQMKYPGIMKEQNLKIDMDLTDNRIIILNKPHEKQINTTKINRPNLQTIINITINTGNNNSTLLIQMIRSKSKSYLMY
jgi:hypothetical protein